MGVPEEQRSREFDVKIDSSGLPCAIAPTGRNWQPEDPLAMAAVPTDATILRSVNALGTWYRDLDVSDDELFEMVVATREAMGDDYAWIPAFTMVWLSERQWKFERPLRPLPGALA